MPVTLVKDHISREVLAEMEKGQFGNFVKASRWQGKDPAIFQGAVERARELLDLTIEDPRWRRRLKELTRVREVFTDALSGGNEYGSSLEDLDRYFFPFALAARLRRG